MDSKTKLATSRFAVKLSLALSGLLVTGGMATAAPCPVGVYCYPGYTYVLPTVRPYIKLTHYQAVNPASTPYIRFKQAADAALAGNPPYAYSATHSATMFALSGTNSYILDAINRVEVFVAAAETAIAAGQRPEIAADSYLDVGFYMEDMALTYDWGYSLLTVSQRARWEAFAQQTLFNVWNPDAASWGGVPWPWSGWSISDPGNNYHFSFLRATMLWAWATKSTTWLNFLQTQKFSPLVNYYALLPGGGSREGTGYGTAMKNLFLNYLYWVDSTTENLALLTPHTRETIDYWVHATVPTRNLFAPIGDQSRSSLPELYDYHENLVQYAVALSPGTNQARHGTWWLQNNSVNGVSNTFNLHGDLLTLPDAPLAPTELFYHATGAGALFARSSWTTDASWVAIVAGKYDQSHAHQDQGSFTFFRGTWLAVTQNIWSHSGINQEVEYHNVLRFKRSNGTIIAQTENPNAQSVMTPTNAGGVLTVVANLTNAYSSQSAALISNWQRTFEFFGNTLRVTDDCTVAAGVTAVFQVQVPVQPTFGANGTVLAGTMTIKPLQGETATFTKLPTAEFNQGWRVEFTKVVPTCSFKIEMSTLTAPVDPPGLATVYRLRHPSIGAYLFTIYPSERDSAQTQYGYLYEGVCCKWFTGASNDGRMPLYRLFSSAAGEYFFTITASERDSAVSQYGYIYEGVAAYCHPASSPAAPNPWYRLRFGNKHLFTIYPSERDAAISQYGYVYEGITCYLPPP